MFNELEQDLQSKAQTWEGGNTYHQQKQHIPGYKGFVPGVNSENLYGKTFSKVTADAFRLKEAQGEQSFDRMQTTYQVYHGEEAEKKIEVQEEVLAKTEVLQDPT